MRKLLLTTLILLCLPLAAVGAEYFWQAGGGSGSACTEGEPCTLATALSTAVDTDTVTCLAGTENISSSVVIDKDITFREQERHQCTINHTGTGTTPTLVVCGTATGGLCSTSGGNGATVDGFKFICNEFVGPDNVRANRGLMINRGSSITIKNFYLSDCTLRASCGTDGCSNNVFENFIIDDAAAESTYLKSDGAYHVNLTMRYGIISKGGKANPNPGWGAADLDLQDHNGFHGHHLLFVDRANGAARENLMRFDNTINSILEDFVVKNVTDSANSIFSNVESDANTIIRDGVVEDSETFNNDVLVWYSDENHGGLGVTTIDGNTYCDTDDFICPFTSCTTNAPVTIASELNIATDPGLPGNAADSACDDEIDRILREAADAGAEFGGLPTPQLSVGEVGSVDSTSLILDLAVTNWPLGATLDDIIACDDTRLTVTGSVSGAISTTGCVVVDADTVDITLASEPVAGETITVQALSRFVQFDTSFGEVAADGGIDLYSIAGASIEATNNLVSAEQPTLNPGTSISSGVALQ